MSANSLDRETLEAIGVLARAVEQSRVPGILEFRLLANALRRAMDSGSERELHEAARVYQTLDREFRARIVERANAEAHALATQGDAVLSSPAAPASGTVRTGSSFLAALNGAGRPTTSRTMPDLLPGEPLPRSR